MVTEVRTAAGRSRNGAAAVSKRVAAWPADCLANRAASRKATSIRGEGGFRMIMLAGVA